jgi:hypothetical protein
LEGFGNSEVSELYVPVFSHENVLGFDIAVDDLAIVDVFDGKTHLSEPS